MQKTLHHANMCLEIVVKLRILRKGGARESNSNVVFVIFFYKNANSIFVITYLKGKNNEYFY